MRQSAESLPARITIREAIERVRSSAQQSWLVTDGPQVMGVINLATLEQGVQESPEKQLVNCVVTINFPHVHADQGLDQALERMGANRIQLLPVVSRADVHQLLGVVTLKDVLQAYGVGPSDSA